MWRNKYSCCNVKGKVNSDCQQLHPSQMKNHLSPQHFLEEVFGSKKFQSNIHNLMWGNILLKRSICEELCSTSASYYDNKMHTLFHLMFKKKNGTKTEFIPAVQFFWHVYVVTFGQWFSMKYLVQSYIKITGVSHYAMYTLDHISISMKQW